MIYLDTAALVKLLHPEPESAALADWLDDRMDTLLLTSTLTEVELPRALRRIDPTLLPQAPQLLERLARHEIDGTVRAAAAAYDQAELRSLDAIHLATAQVVLGSRITAFVTYDRRLLLAAAKLGMPVGSPGVAARSTPPMYREQ
jgi:predicted nucleic acid-binding protein